VRREERRERGRREKREKRDEREKRRERESERREMERPCLCVFGFREQKSDNRHRRENVSDRYLD
jgi:hypothetical protein